MSLKINSFQDIETRIRNFNILAVFLWGILLTIFLLLPWWLGLSTGLLIFISLGIKLYKRYIHLWFPSYFNYLVTERYKKPKFPIHIMFMLINHFEAPLGEKMIGSTRLYEWLTKYPLVVKNHRDNDGYLPQHTWFYAAEKFQFEGADKEFSLLNTLCKMGLGEIEFHLHHHNDSSDNLREKIKAGIKNFNRYGALIVEDGSTPFAFVHGSWALDNSRYEKGRNCCGVNNELQLLKELNCYADFTFPSYGFMSQPKKINSIYYAQDDPDRPKSYDTGVDVSVNKPPSGDLMLIEGPLGILWCDWRHLFYPQIESGDITGNNPPTKYRIDQWIKLSPYVKGKPEWRFVKVYCHGGYDETMKVVLGRALDNMFSYLEEKYNDGENYILHYVTCREAYNIVKAAESGCCHNPGLYRDYLIKPYLNVSGVNKSSIPPVTSTDIEVSIVIVNWNVREQVLKCIESLVKTVHIKNEVIVVDNNSNDGSIRAIKEKYPQVKAIQLDKNNGFSRANNIGMRLAKGKYILFANPDVEFMPGAVENMIDFLKQNPDYGMVGPKIINLDGTIQTTCHRDYPTIKNELILEMGLERFSRKLIKRILDEKDFSQPQDMKCGSGSCMLLRREAVYNIGGFNEEYFLYGEDVELCFTLSKKGWKLKYLPSSIVLHLKASSTKQCDYSQMRRHYYNASSIYFRQAKGLGYVMLYRSIILITSLTWYFIEFLFRRDKVKKKEILRKYKISIYWALGIRKNVYVTY